MCLLFVFDCLLGDWFCLINVCVAVRVGCLFYLLLCYVMLLMLVVYVVCVLLFCGD